MVAAQDQGEVAARRDPLHLPRDHLERARDLAEIAGARVADLERLHVLDDDVTLVHDGVAELAQPIGEPGDADGGGAHVHAAPTRSEVHRHTEHADDHGRASE